ncbi:hypothetical protein BO221_24670 [Archangium sp. Cb G35]|nr:hypothetical protein BO221_24670 [Archangium sp. Cb G35]
MLLGGRFLCRRRIRQQGEVQAWDAMDLSTGSRVAMKVAPLDALHPGVVERVTRELAALREARSRWVSPPLHIGLDAGLAYQVRPWLSGRTLRERLSQGPLSLEETLQIGRGVLRALQAAHSLGVVHLHVQPSNVILGGEDSKREVTLVDFGLTLDDLREQSLQALPLEDVLYLAPEQAGLVEHPVGRASDLHAVGVLLFECLAGAPPFQGRTLGSILQQQLTTHPELRALGLPVPRALEQVVQHLMRKDPRERYQSAEAALEDLEAISARMERGEHEPTLVVGLSDARRRLNEPTFIGRGAELDALEGTLGEAARGRGGLALAQGGSGSGKTLLLDEWARRARARGVRVFRGQGVDRSGQQYIQVLAGVVEELLSALEESPSLAEELRTRLGAQLEAVCEAIPQLAGPLGHPDPVRLGHEEMGVHRTGRALRALLEALGNSGSPTVVLLDDCQWADELTLELLAAWVRPSVEEPRDPRFVAVVAAFRTEEVPEGHPLRRLEPALRITVSPFPAPELRRLAESMAGRLPEEALDTVVRLSEGNPFMASSVVRGLVESGALVPGPSGWRVEPQRLAEVRSSRQATTFLLRRLALLPEPAQRLMAAGAILGREFPADVAATLARQEPREALAALEEARQRHLLWPGPSSDRWVFSHDRLREALLERLPADEARALHHAAALEWERRAPEQYCKLAYHFEAAGEFHRAWPHALEAAREGRNRHALEIAELNYRLAERGAEEEDDATRLAILEELGEVLLIRLKAEEADQCFARAQALATSRLDHARLQGHRGEVASQDKRFTEAVRAYRGALHQLGQSLPRNRFALLLYLLWEWLLRVLRAPRAGGPPLEGETRLAAHLYIQLSTESWIQGGWLLTTLYSHLRGLNIAERHAPTPILATAYACHGSLFALLFPYVPGFLRASALRRERKYIQEALRLYRSLGNVFDQGSTLAMYHYTLFSAARFEECVESGREAERLLRQTGATAMLLFVRSNLATALQALGKPSAALEEANRLQGLAVELDHRLSLATGLLVQAYASEGHLPRERLEAELTRATHTDEVSQSMLLQAEGVRLLAAGEATQAARAFTQALGMVGPLMRSKAPPLLFAFHPSLMTALREQALQLSPYASTRRAALLRQARAAARQGLRFPGGARAHRPHIFRELGRIAALEQHHTRARRYLDKSLAAAERLGMGHERALTLLARAEVGTALGWPGASKDAAAGEEALRSMRGAREPAHSPEARVSLSLVDRFPRILEAGHRIASALTREAVFAAVREAVQGLLRGEHDELIELTQEHTVPESVGGTLRAVILRALEGERPWVPSEEELEALGTPGMRSALCAPILARGQVVACFCVTSHGLAGAFGAEEARIAEFIATLAGAALENAQGFAEVLALSEERQRLYQQAQAALRKRDEFLAVASHELRTPFTPMRLYMQSLLNALRQPARAAGMEPWVAKLEMANARLQRLARLVEDLFDVSRLSQRMPPLRLGEVDLPALVREAADRWKEELQRVRCELVLEVLAEPLVGFWDALRLEQVIDNLLSNAIKYGPGKPIHLSVTREGGAARLVVRDEGMGIAPEDQARIFERFERAVSEDNYGGFGLGLWLSREVVRALGGRISVSSAPGQGATFTVELPLTPVPAPS